MGGSEAFRGDDGNDSDLLHKVRSPGSRRSRKPPAIRALSVVGLTILSFVTVGGIVALLGFVAIPTAARIGDLIVPDPPRLPSFARPKGADELFDNDVCPGTEDKLDHWFRSYCRSVRFGTNRPMEDIVTELDAVFHDAGWKTVTTATFLYATSPDGQRCISYQPFVRLEGYQSTIDVYISSRCSG